MTESRLSKAFLRAVVILTGFKPDNMRRTQAALLLIGLEVDAFTAADLPAEIANGDKHISGAATGALISEGLLVVTGRIKSPDPSAKGRKLDVLHLASDKKALTWLKANDIDTTQMCYLRGREMAREHAGCSGASAKRPDPELFPPTPQRIEQPS